MNRYVFVIALLVAACTRNSGDVCCTTAVDCAAVGLSTGTDCEAGRACSNHQCVAAVCAIDGECPAERPVCTDGLCVECDAAHGCAAEVPACNVITQTCGSCASDAECGTFVATPLCSQATGACVECRDADPCGPGAPVCDAGTCRACRLDAECGSGACGEDGACVVEQNIVYVSPSGVDAGSCTRLAPCRTLQFGMVKTLAARSHIVAAAGSYPANLTVVTGAPAPVTVSLHATGAVLSPAAADRPIIDTTATAVALAMFGGEVAGATTAGSILVGAATRLEHVSIHDTNTVIVSGSLTARDVRIATASGRTGIIVEDQASLTFDGGQITGGSFGIRGGTSATIDAQNMIITGTSTRAVDCPRCIGTIRFTTIANSGGGSLVPPCAMECGPMMAVSSSIIWQTGCGGAPNLAVSGGCTFASTIAGPTPVAGTMTLDPLFANPAGGDYHLQPSSPAVDAIDTGPDHDFEGDPRPRGASFDLGADESP